MLIRSVLLFLLATFVCLAVAEARVDITPRRVILNPRDRAGEFTLLNMGDKEGTIRVAIINYSQDENGVYKILEGPLNPAFDPEALIRLSPRQFTIAPEGRQKVRFSVRKPADLPDGEYRFHLIATQLADQGPPTPELAAGEKKINVSTNVGAAIPVIVRHGAVEASATLSNPVYTESNKDGRPELKVDINRSGNASTIGTIRIYWSPAGGESQEIGYATNINVFNEITLRHVTIQLKDKAAGSGTFRVVYINDENGTPFAETQLQR